MDKLQKRYGLLTAICMVVGIVIGSGVFFKAQTILQKTGGNMPLGILAWIIGGVIMLTCLLAFSVMAQKFEKVNGIVDYAEACVSSRYAYYIGWFLSIIYYPCLTSVLAWLSARYTLVFITSVAPDFPLLGLGAAAIGGKDSMSGTFLDHDVPPTLISFAIAPVLAGEIVTTDFKAAGHGVYLFDGATPEEQKAAWERFTALARAGKAASAWAVENGLAEAVMKMSLGNEVGFAAASTALDWYRPMPGTIVAELTEEIPDAVCIGITTAEKTISIGSDEASISELLALNDAVLESVYPTKTQDAGTVVRFTYETEKRVAPAVKTARPKALIPVFPGTNCEYDTQRALLEAGADAEQFIIRNLTSADVADSVERFAKAVKDSQIIVIPGGFSGGDEPDGSAKLITAFFRNAAVKEQVTDLLEKRDGLMLGVCNGFQAFIKLGLVPYGKIMDTDADFPTLTYNVIGRHQSRLVRTRVCSNKSPWLAGTKVGDIYTVPISHGEGRFLASEELVKKLAENGQIATQYVDLDGDATMDAAFNPNGSICAIEGITSPDGRVFGKMGHTERIGKELYRNVPGQYEMELFTSAVRYFK